MDKKCTKYENLFIFSDENTLKKHIEECPECKTEYEKMEKISNILDEVKFYYYAQKKKKRNLKFRAACALFLVVFSSLSFGIIANQEDLLETLTYGRELSAEDLGFPVDSYGLLMVDDEF